MAHDGPQFALGPARAGPSTVAQASPAAAPTVHITVNGVVQAVQSPPDTPLLYVLRNELGLRGPRFGCGLGQCSACTVLLDGQSVHSCRLPLSRVGSGVVTTLEGLGTPDRPHPLQTAFIEEQAAQCGYCINGWIMTAAGLLAHTPHPTEYQIRASLGRVICRCGAHTRILRAVRRAAGAG